MFEKLENSWELAKQCWRVLMLDKEMLAFPLMTIITTVLVMSGITYPFWANGYFDQSATDPVVIDGSFNILAIALLCVIPVYICYFITVFFNTGLITCAFIRLCGGDPVIKDGFVMAWHRLPQVFTWSLLAATIGLVLGMLKGRNNFLQSIFGATLALGWRVASFFTVPIIVAEEKGAIKALKESGKLIRKNWGEALTLEIGFSILAYPAIVPVFALLGLAYSTTATMPVIAFSLIAIGIIYAFVVSLVISTLDAIAKAALYMYAQGEHLPKGFEPELLEKVFKRTSVEKPSWA